MAMQQRDIWIDELDKTDALLQFALASGDEQEVERLRKKMRRLAGLGDADDCKPAWNGEN